MDTKEQKLETLRLKKAIYDGLLKKYEIGDERLIKWLETTDFYFAPANPSTNMSGCYPGGLVQHLINVGTYMLKQNEMLPEELKIPKKNIVTVALLHDLGKINLFKINTNDYFRKQGKLYEYNNDLTSMQIGERTIFYLQNLVTFSADEFQTILFYGKNDDKQAEYFGNIMVSMLRNAIKMSEFVMKNNSNSI